MGFVVLHMEKAHGSDSGTTAHIERFIIPKNADPTRKIGNNQVRAIRINASGTPEDMTRIEAAPNGLPTV